MLDTPATLRVQWAADQPPDPRLVRVRRRWFWAPSDSLVVGRTIWTRLAVMSDRHVRGELGHVPQYERWGIIGFWRRYLTGQRKAIEAEAHANEPLDHPTWEMV